MNYLLVGIIIGVLLAVVAFSVLTESCPPVREIITAWDELAETPPTVGRGPVPRRAPVLTANVRGLRAADVSRFGGKIAGDRPPRYGNRGVSARDLRFVRP